MPLADKNGMSALIDGDKLPLNMPCPAYAIKKGDDRSSSIAAASIIAKLARDRIMENLHIEHPEYGWNTNVGYPSPAHKIAIKKHGITIHHRRSFAPVREYLAANAA
jgi:ribonuclease HII